MRAFGWFCAVVLGIVGLATFGSVLGNDGNIDKSKVEDITSRFRGSPSTSFEPASGPVIRGSTYSFNAPEGWEDPQEDPPGIDFDSSARNRGPTKSEDFQDNVSVMKASGREATATLDELESEVPKTLEGTMRTDVTVNDRVFAAGFTGVHLSWYLNSGQQTAHLEQFYLGVDERYKDIGRSYGRYIITFAFGNNFSPEERIDVAKSVLATWKWDDWESAPSEPSSPRL